MVILFCFGKERERETEWERGKGNERDSGQSNRAGKAHSAATTQHTEQLCARFQAPSPSRLARSTAPSAPPSAPRSALHSLTVSHILPFSLSLTSQHHRHSSPCTENSRAHSNTIASHACPNDSACQSGNHGSLLGLGRWLEHWNAGARKVWQMGDVL
jgi:hypothetical protein